jgi:hypothetical protein
MQPSSHWLIIIVLCLLTVSCTNRARSSAPAATPDPKQQNKGMYFAVSRIERLDHYVDAKESLKPSKPENDFEQIVVTITPAKDATILIDPRGGKRVLTTTEGKLALELSPLGTDSKGNKLEALVTSWLPGGGPAKEITLTFLFELPKTATVATLQFDDFAFDVGKNAPK